MTMGLKTLRPDMLKPPNPTSRPSVRRRKATSHRPLPGRDLQPTGSAPMRCRPKSFPKPDPRRVTPVEPSKSPVRALIPVVVPDPAASTVETRSCQAVVPEFHRWWRPQIRQPDRSQAHDAVGCAVSTVARRCNWNARTPCCPRSLRFGTAPAAVDSLGAARRSGQAVGAGD